MSPVLRQGIPVLFPESLTLGKQSSQIGPLRHLVAVERLIDTVAASLIVIVTHRYHVDALTRFQSNLPVVLWHTRHHIVVRQMPLGTNKTVLYPDMAVLLRKGNLHHRVLHEDRRMRFTIQVHDLPLVVDEVLEPQR